MSEEDWLDHRLRADSVWVADAELCQLRLARDRRWPWLILVPKLDGARELSELSLAQWMTLGTELRRASAVLVDLYRSYKINIAALGNNVQQLHVHVVGRNPDDPNWPGPIWGFGKAEHFTDSELQHQLENVRRAWHTERFSNLAT